MGFLDREMSDGLRLGLEREGHHIRLGDAVSTIERIPGDCLRIRLKSGAELRVDKVLYSAGRAGNTRGLGLDRAGVKMDEKGRILVNEHFQTSAAHVYAAGDVIGSPALASVSMEQAGRDVPRVRHRLQDQGLRPDPVRCLHHSGNFNGRGHRGSVATLGVDFEVGRAAMRTTPRPDHRRA
jgi:NAD(P) transhydrogenase